VNAEPLREVSGSQLRNRENIIVSTREIRQLFDSIKELGDVVKRQNVKIERMAARLDDSCKELNDLKTALDRSMTAVSLPICQMDPDMTLDTFRLRSDFLGTQVITRNSGRRLGIVSQVWVDVDRAEVVAVGLRENILSGVVATPQQQVMLLGCIRQIGDVILVDDDTVLDDEVNVDPYSTLINCEVVTETGEPLGRVRGFKFDVTNGKLESIIVASLGLPQIPDQVISTYELPFEEIVSSGPDRLIVFEGAEEKLMQLSVGLMERLGIGSPPWEHDDGSEYIMPVSTSNQLPSGVQQPAKEVFRERPPIADTRWSDDDLGEPEPLPVEEPVQRQQAQMYRQLDSEPEGSNWSDESDQPAAYPDYDADYREVTEDVWTEAEAEAEAKPYEAPRVNIPQKKKATEYEEELDY